MGQDTITWILNILQHETLTPFDVEKLAEKIDEISRLAYERESKYRDNLDKALGVIKFYAEYDNWNHNEMTKSEDLEQFVVENQCDFGTTEYLLQDEVGGYTAREFLKSLGGGDCWGNEMWELK